MTTLPTCWAISDGAAGNERQASALARALGLVPRLVRVRLREPWNLLAPRLLRGAAGAIRSHDDQPLSPPWPDLAIGCGRRAALVTRTLRHWSGGDTFTVQILDPRIDPRAFDLVIAPGHDPVRGANVLTTLGALNPVDADWLAAGRAAFAPLAQLPEPRTVVLVGGSTTAQRIDDDYLDRLAQRLRELQAGDGGSLLVSMSRRSDPQRCARLRAALASVPGLFWGGDADGPNPYAGLLGWGERFVVTPDSVNMISEACATGRPVFTFLTRPVLGKLAAFHAELRGSGHLRLLGEPLARPQPPPLDETSAIAELVRERWRSRRDSLQPGAGDTPNI